MNRAQFLKTRHDPFTAHDIDHETPKAGNHDPIGGRIAGGGPMNAVIGDNREDPALPLQGEDDFVV